MLFFFFFLHNVDVFCLETAMSLCLSICLSVHHFSPEWNIWTTLLLCCATTFFTDMHSGHWDQECFMFQQQLEIWPHNNLHTVNLNYIFSSVTKTLNSVSYVSLLADLKHAPEDCHYKGLSASWMTSVQCSRNTAGEGDCLQISRYWHSNATATFQPVEDGRCISIAQYVE